MGKISKTRDALYVKLGSALNDFRKPTAVASQIELGFRVSTTAIAPCLPARSSEHVLQKRISLVPPAGPEVVSELPKKDPIAGIYAACTWLTHAQNVRAEEKDSTDRRESAIAMRVAELQERLGKAK